MDNDIHGHKQLPEIRSENASIALIFVQNPQIPDSQRGRVFSARNVQSQANGTAGTFY
jgi:hypothetical protein